MEDQAGVRDQLIGGFRLGLDGAGTRQIEGELEMAAQNYGLRRAR
jgi:hypothetical protein